MNVAARRRLSPLLPFAILFAATTVSADEVRLHDGRVLVGTVVKKQKDGVVESLEITTRDGVVSVRASEVLQHLTDDELRKKLAETARGAEDSTFAHLQLALQARAWGLLPELWKHLDRAVTLEPATTANAGLQRRLHDFLGSLEPELLPRKWRSATTKARVHQLLDGVHGSTSPGRAAAIEELLVREDGADQELRLQARRNTSVRQRITVLAALQRRGVAGNDRFVLRTAILDGNEQVRTAAVEISRDHVAADDIAYLAAGLAHENAKVRVRTADALGGLGHADAIDLLVRAAPHAATGLAAGANDGQRGHIAILQQTSYIRDFDVEVAQAAIIADPKVDVLTSGSVLDVTVAGTIEVRTILRSYRTALKRLTQSDPGDDVRSWPQWLGQIRPEPAQAPAPTTPKR
ncbi:MAG: hypothetical protein WBO45_14465 [Planctomycetota bacterium]